MLIEIDVDSFINANHIVSLKTDQDDVNKLIITMTNGEQYHIQNNVFVVKAKILDYLKEV